MKSVKGRRIQIVENGNKISGTIIAEFENPLTGREPGFQMVEIRWSDGDTTVEPRD